LRAQRVGQLGVDLGSVLRPSAARQGEHVQAAEAFAGRIGSDEFGQLAEDEGVPAEGQINRNAVLDRAKMLLGQPQPATQDGRSVAGTSEGIAPPQLQRAGQQA